MSASVARYCCCAKCPASLIMTLADVVAWNTCVDSGGPFPGSLKCTVLDINGMHELPFESFDASTNRCIYTAVLPDAASVDEWAGNDCTGSVIATYIEDVNLRVEYDRVTGLVDWANAFFTINDLRTGRAFSAANVASSDASAFALGVETAGVIALGASKMGDGGTVIVELPA